MHQQIKKLKSKKNNSTQGLLNKNGTLVFNSEDKKKRWTEYGKELYSDEKRSTTTTKDVIHCKENANELLDITKAEIEASIKRLKRAARIDGMLEK